MAFGFLLLTVLLVLGLRRSTPHCSVIAVHQKHLHPLSISNTPVSPAFTPNVIFIAFAFCFFLVIYLILSHWSHDSSFSALCNYFIPSCQPKCF